MITVSARNSFSIRIVQPEYWFKFEFQKGNFFIWRGTEGELHLQMYRADVGTIKKLSRSQFSCKPEQGFLFWTKLYLIFQHLWSLYANVCLQLEPDEFSVRFWDGFGSSTLERARKTAIHTRYTTGEEIRVPHAALLTRYYTLNSAGEGHFYNFIVYCSEIKMFEIETAETISVGLVKIIMGIVISHIRFWSNLLMPLLNIGSKTQAGTFFRQRDKETLKDVSCRWSWSERPPFTNYKVQS